MSAPAPQPFAAIGQRIDVTPSITPTSVTNGTFSVQTFTVTGLDPIQHQFIQVGQQAWASGSQSQTSGIVITNAFCAAAGVLTIVFYNTAGAPATPAAGVYSFICF